MKLFFSFCFLVLFYSGECIAQVTVTNNGVTITNLNQTIHLNGNVVNQTSGFLKNNGNIYVNGNITNNGTTAFCDSSSGQVHLNGTGQKINGTHTLNFHRLILNTADTLKLEQSIKVIDSLSFTNGFIDLNGQTIDLDTSGYLSNERLSSHLYGITGKIISRKYLNQPVLADNAGGLGLRIRSNNNHGLTTVERSHFQQPAADSSIYRFYKVSSQYPNLIDSISVFYFNDEKFKNEANYKVFSKKYSGNNGWINRGGTVDFVGKEVSVQSPILLDTALFTVADENCSMVPDINVTGVTNLVPMMSVDTITCANDTLNINAYSSVPNAVIIWKDISDSIFSNPLQVSSPGFYFIDVTDGVNGCTNNILVNITQDKIPPLLDALSDSVFLNCSQSSLQLNGNSPTPLTALLWTGASFSSPDPATVNATGNYYLTGTRSDNGCIKIDSVLVGYKPQLILLSSQDTLVCKNSTILLSTSETGSLTGVNYSWSNGTASASTTVQPIVTATYIITANSPGCSGKDTIVVTVPPDMIDSVATYKPCNGTTFGTILLYVYGGIPPYKYSINNGAAFSSTGTFTNIPFGTYNVLIKDSLGCTTSNTAVLNGFSGLPVPQFIASTQNAKGDTIVLVDISTPQPDSVSWIFPPQAKIIGGDKFNPVVYMPDTGAFPVTMIGYWADCVLDTTKLIYFHPTDTATASEYNNNGIKSLTLYPNPNNGTFTVGVEFYKKQNSSIQIWDTSPTKYFQKNFIDTGMITLPVSLTQLVNGTYILRVIGEYNTKHLNFIISH
ncbi:MAG: hypothetical protein EPN85_03190 [Bacteroidetes bacterium]|nr:MAG: hypothetical protein EPN85_03190 [Bacteroidota bacterium]